jgi:CRISPR system Cascade subunit CasA
MSGGAFQLLSLRSLFAEATGIEGIDAAPHERVSLMRLLVCLTQAALGAPPDAYGWVDFGSDMATAVPSYLSRADVHPHMELFGPGPRFLQEKVAPLETPILASKLMPHLATGNNTTMLDHSGGNERAFPPAMLALALLTFQNFYPLYGTGYKGKGPCADGNMAHTLLTGRNLAETILLNALDADLIGEFFRGAGMGRPMWELGTAGEAAQTNATQSYLGRLVPRHRNLWLGENGVFFDLSNESMQYPAFDEGGREPTSTVIVTTKGSSTERRLLPLRMERALWRDLHTLLVLRASNQQTQQAPLTLQSHMRQLGDRSTRLWVGGLVTDKAKVLDTTESSFTLPESMFHAFGREMYQKGVEAAEAQSRQLFGAVKKYAASMKHESAPDAVASRDYWHSLDQESGLLLRLIADPSLLNDKQIGEPDGPWGRIVKTAALNAYANTCLRVTPRQQKAYIEGLRVLFPKSKSGPPKKKAAKQESP